MVYNVLMCLTLTLATMLVCLVLLQSTSNYLARQYGVRAAMPGFIGKKLCPELIIVKPNYDKYRQISTQVREVLAFYDPHFCSVGLDEAYLDLTAFVRNRLSPNVGEEPIQQTVNHASISFGGDSGPKVAKERQELLQLPSLYWKCAEEVVEELRDEIFNKVGLTASAGIAPNKMLAKVASDVNKPNGQYTVNPTKEGVLKFVHDLPIRKV